MRAMRPLPLLLFLLFLLSACGRDPEQAPPPDVPAPKPKLPVRLPGAPQERIAFVRPDGLWTISSDGSDLTRIVPPTLPQAAEPTWSFDRRWICFTAAGDVSRNLYPRNVFVARPDGEDVRQVTPLPRADAVRDDDPKGIVRGRAVWISDQDRRPIPHLTVLSYGLRLQAVTDADGTFQAYLPAGGGWIKIAGTVDGRRVIARRFAPAAEGQITNLKDVPLLADTDDEPSSPAWCDQDRQLLYVLHQDRHGRSAGTPRCTLRRIRVDGSGDESVAAFAAATVLAGPVVRGDSAWLKMSDGTVIRIDLKTKAVAESHPAGIAAPDALAVSPNGSQVATLTLDATGARKLVILNKDAELTLLDFKPGEPSPRGFDFSPDGTRLVLDRTADDGKSGLSILTIATRTLTSLTDSGYAPVWYGR
jgi:hypothetical protein